ncbi:MAG: glutamate racemase [Clostridiales bacterium]|jgi:glutamate racemase|nr:glutamate racemase [Clostridiales bacterium]MDN5282490.1 glutamate racemase [Candidatus Ozemobacter sp.]
MDTRPIGVFDSGVGGLTVFKEIRQLLPHEDLIYFGDTARVPYGGKSIKVIQKYSNEISRFLEIQGIKMLVVACNTASALALNRLKNECSVPVIGVIDPGVRAAVKAANGGLIGVIGTRGTINSEAYQKRILRLRSGIEVLAKACPLLVPIVEENVIDSEIARLAIHMYLKDFKKVSSLILACTHYPLLKNVIRDYLGPEVALIDSAEETAIEVKEMLQARRITGDESHIGLDQFFVSDSPESFTEIGEAFLGRPMQGGCFLHSWQNDD